MSGVAVLLMLALVAPAGAYHPGDIIVGSSEAGGGRLAARFDFSRRVHVSPAIALGDLVLHTATDPGFDALDVVEPGLHQLPSGTPVSLEVVALDAPASVQLKAQILDQPGTAAPVGVMTADGDGLHVHPTWRLALGADAPAAEYRLIFRLTTTSRRYAPSEPYTLMVTNAPAGEATTTTTTLDAASTTTTTTFPPPCAEWPSASTAAIGCRHALLRDAVVALPTPDRAARRTARALFRLTAACGRLLRAAAPARRGERRRRRAIARLTAFDQAVARAGARGRLAAGDVPALHALAAALRAEIIAGAGERPE